MCNDRIFTIYDGRIITAFVEHTHINTEYVEKYTALCIAPSSGLMIIRWSLCLLSDPVLL